MILQDLRRVLRGWDGGGRKSLVWEWKEFDVLDGGGCGLSVSGMGHFDVRIFWWKEGEALSVFNHAEEEARLQGRRSSWRNLNCPGYHRDINNKQEQTGPNGRIWNS